MEPIERTKQVLDKLGWSWAKLARELGTNDQRLYNWRQRGLPEGEAHRVAKAIGVSTDWLLTGEGPMKHAVRMDAQLDPVSARFEVNASDRSPPSHDEVLGIIAELMGAASPRSRQILVGLVEAAERGELTEEDLVFVEQLVNRIKR